MNSSKNGSTVSTAYTLALVGAAFQLLGGLLRPLVGFWWMGYPAMMPGMGMMWGSWPGFNLWASPIWLAWLGGVVGLSFLAAYWIGSRVEDKVRAGSIIALVIAILAFPTMWGLAIGSLLLFIAGILGLTWQPAREV